MDNREIGFRKTLYRYALERKQTDFIIRADDQVVYCHKLVVCGSKPLL